MRIDHVILATSDLDAAAARLEAEHGLRAVAGGRHEGLGTHNRIVPLGRGYLELLAVADPEEAAGSDLGRALSARIANADGGLMAWCVAVEDIEAVAAHLGIATTGIARQGLTARLTGLPEALAEPCLPFFIQRDPGVADPAAGGDARGITWIEISCDEERLVEWIGVGAELPVRLVDGPPGITAVGIGDRELRPGGPPR